ncbi:PREDICTED: uncharacterized protein LOC106537467, partial [Thamnophis sirtalis]|uniref:Uncharacterized protein LOC106537467 n=1 Tax=Thamnophis sirtalis TaxID=35019 RepID=A0A6I9WVX8_9SAUR
MEPPEEPVSGEKLDLAAPGPRVAKGSPSKPKPAPARASPRTRAKAPPAKNAPKAAKKAAQIPPKALDTVDAAGEKEQKRPLVDGAAACSASQPLQPVTEAGETPSPSCPPDGAREELSQPQLPVMEPAEPSSLPPASTPLPPESPSEEPAAKRAKPATPEAADPPAAAGLCPKKAQEPGMQNKQPAVSAASDSALRQGQATAPDAPIHPSTASSMDILKSLSVVDGPEDLPLSGDIGETPDPLSCRRLFSPLLFKKLLQKAGIGADPAASNPALSDPKFLLFAERPQIREEIPSPKFFLDVFQQEWQKPNCFTNPDVNHKRYYNVDKDLTDSLKIPTVDGPVAALVSSTVLPTSVEDHLTTEEKRMEMMLRKVNSSAAWAVKSAVAASFFNRTSLLWLKEMQARIPATDLQTHEHLNKLIAAAQFSADATLSSATYASRAIGNSVTVRRLLWLRYWQTDNRSKWRLASAPFKGDKLFGEALEPLLKETHDKKKVLPSTFKRAGHKSSSNVQKPSFRGGNNTHNSSQLKRSYFQRPNRQSDRAGYIDRSRQQFQSKQPFQDNRSRLSHDSSRGLRSQHSEIQPSRGQAAAGDCSPKRFKEMKSDSRVKKTQQASGIQEIKNPVHTGQHPSGRLPEVNRSHGNISTRPPIADSPTISMDTPRKSAFPVQGPHKDTSYTFGSPQDYRYSRPTLSGQPVDRIVSPPAHREPPCHDPDPSGSFRESGIQSQPRQEPLVSYQKDAPSSSTYRRDIVPSLPVPGPPAQHQRSGEPHPIGSNGASRPRLTIVRQDGVLRLPCSRGTSAYQDLTMAPPAYSEIRQEQFNYRRLGPIRSPPGVDATDHNQHIQGNEPSHDRYGRRFSWLESPDRDRDGRRSADR